MANPNMANRSVRKRTFAGPWVQDNDWLLRLEAQRYAKTPEAGLPALRAEFRKMAWPR